jgi:uncharacterized membrane protein
MWRQVRQTGARSGRRPVLETGLAYFTGWTTGVLGQSHLLTALVALGSGAWVLWARKGTRLHARSGYVYVVSMVLLNGTALAKYDLTGGVNMFHAAAIGSLLTLAGAFAAALVFRRTRDRRAIAAHGHLMIWSYFGLFAALVAEVVTRALPFMLHGEGGWTRFTLALAAFMLITGAITWRYARFEVRRTMGL